MINIECKHVTTEQQKTQTKLTFSTTEPLSDLELAHIEKAPGFLLFKADNITQEQELAMKDKRIGLNTDGQSASKKLRAAIYDYWFKHINNREFEDYYSEVVDTFILRIKSKSNEA